MSHQMTRGQLLGLSLRLLQRTLKSGKILLLIGALMVAITTHTSIGLVSDRFQKSMVQQSSAVLGGDLVVRSPFPDPDMGSLTQNFELARVVEFPSVVFAGDNMQLSAIKAVSQQYPLNADLRIAPAPFAADQRTDTGPSPGEAWLEPRLFGALKLATGDVIEVGDIELTVTAAITFEPDLGEGFYNMMPRVMMHLDDLAAANLIQTGSRANYFYQISGSANAIAELETQLEETLKPGQQLVAVGSRSRSLGSALERAQNYLNLASLVAVLLAAVALAMGTRFFSASQFDTAALLRSFGLKANQILWLFANQLVCIALLGSLLGGLLGWGLHWLIIQLLSSFLPDQLPAPGFTTFWTGTLLALLIVMGLGLPSLMQLQRTPPLRVLRRQLQAPGLSAASHYLIIAGTVLLLMQFYVAEINLVIGLVVGAGCIWLLSLASAWLVTHFSGLASGMGPLWFRAGLRQFHRRGMMTRVQILGFGMAAMAMLLVFLVRGELVENWRQRIPAEAPNYFVLNVLADQQAQFANSLAQRGFDTQPLYPMIPGRLTAVNDTPLLEVLGPNKPLPRALDRELNLSWSDQLPDDNRLVAGDWWSAASATTDSQVSVEYQLAKTLGLELGDSLEFSVADQSFTATVASFRTLSWETMQPNFYMLFNPVNVPPLPHTFMTSFYVSPALAQEAQSLLREFPSVTLLSVDAILGQLRQILNQVSVAVEFILIFVLLAGASITWASLVTTLPERLRESAIMRALGASKRQLRWQLWLEFFAVGLAAGIVACAGTEVIRYAVFSQLFGASYQPHVWTWFLIPLLLGLFVSMAGQLASGRITRQSPIQVLREL